MLQQLPMLQQPLIQEVQVLRISKRRSPGDFLEWGTQSQSRSFPGDFLLHGTVWGWTQSPSSTRQKHQVTLVKERAPSLTEESQEHDARVDEALQLLLQMWQTEEAPFKEANWLRPKGEAGMILAKVDENLECPLPLEPHLQELPVDEEPSLAGTEAGDSLPLPPISTPEDPELSPLCQLDWIVWHARHVEMPPWWWELVKIPDHNNYQEFAQKVHASFKMLKACNLAKRVDNDHTPPLTHPSIGNYHFMPPANVRFGSQDYQLAQSHHTITYVRVLQYWTEKAQPPIPGQPNCLVKSVMEFQWAMEPLVSFLEGGIFAALALSNWMEVSSLRLSEPISWDPCPDCSCSQRSWAHPGGSCQQSKVKGDLLPLQRQMCPPLHSERWFHHSLTTRLHAFHPG